MHDDATAAWAELALAAGPAGFATTGYTASDNLASNGAAQSALAPGGYDAFVRAWDNAGVPAWSSYLGGSGASTNEQALSIALDPEGNVYVAGVTASTNFPVTAGALRQTAGAVPYTDAFVTKIPPP